MSTFPRANSRLTPAEMKPLICEARKAYDTLAEHGLLEPGETFEDWRHREVSVATGGRAAGLSKAHSGQWRAIMQHFLAFQGRDIESYEMGMRTGKAQRRVTRGATAEPGETVEDRELGQHLLAQTLAETRYREPYAQAIAWGKFGTRDLSKLDAGQLRQICTTLGNRARARDGKGKAWNRNKSQREKAESGKRKAEMPATRALNPGFMQPWVSLAKAEN